MTFQGKERCKKCSGHKVYSTESVAIISICNYCGGRGVVDWIDNMTGNSSPLPPDLVMKERVAMQNAQALISTVKSILYGVEINVNVVIEKNKNHAHHHSHYVPSHNHNSMSVDKIGYHAHIYQPPDIDNKRIVLMSI